MHGHSACTCASLRVRRGISRCRCAAGGRCLRGRRAPPAAGSVRTLACGPVCVCVCATVLIRMGSYPHGTLSENLSPHGDSAWVLTRMVPYLKTCHRMVCLSKNLHGSLSGNLSWMGPYLEICMGPYLSNTRKTLFIFYILGTQTT